ncbi:hypothetical protein AnigIFM49718_009876 [Aspergillus niger]|nr:hypothetical protein AnigIFM49718_009876 [Aspergillus niger]
MVTGVEATGIALAVLPFVINQLDNYVLGIEKIKVFRRFRRHLANYVLDIGTQHAIFVNYLEQVLDDVVDDEDRLSDLISHPPGQTPGNDPWADQGLRNRLQAKLGGHYEFFIGNMTRVYSLLESLAEKLDMDLTNPSPKEPGEHRFRAILSKAVLDDLLQKLTSVNDILKILIDQSAHRGATQTRRKRGGWNNTLLQRYQRARKYAEGLFRAILQGEYWKCRCREHHCVYLQLQCNPVGTNHGLNDNENESKFRVLFSNALTQGSTIWNWKEVEFEPSEEGITMAHLAITERTGNMKRREQPLETMKKKEKKKGVHFKVDTVVNIKTSSSSSTGSMLENIGTDSAIDKSMAGPILDFCSVLRMETCTDHHKTIGFISHGTTDGNVRYTVHAVNSSHQRMPQYSVREILSTTSRRERLHIAAGLACGLIQYYGNWLKPSWESSDVRLAVDKDGRTALLDSLYLSWPLSGQPAGITGENAPSCPHVQNDILFPLALTLIELSVGETIGALWITEDGNGNPQTTKFNTACRLIKEVQWHSCAAYAEVVRTCLFWSGVGSCFGDGRFEERVFDTVVSPLVEDLVYFEGLRVI